MIMKICPLCDRAVDFTNEHHLVPASKGGKVKIEICIPCHNTIHDIFALNELRDVYNTLEALKAHERFSKYLKWIAKKPSGFYPCFKEKK